MSNELQLKHQNVCCKIDFATKSIAGESTMVIGYRLPSSSDDLLHLPLQIPSSSICRINRILVNSEEMNYSIHETNEMNCEDNIPNSHFDILTANLMKTGYMLDCISPTLLLDIPTKCIDNLSITSPKKKKRKKSKDMVDGSSSSKVYFCVEVQFELFKLNGENCNLLFVEQTFEVKKKLKSFTYLFFSQQVDRWLCWFPTVPLNGYASSRCSWKCRYEVPRGYTAVGPGNLVKRHLSVDKASEVFVFEVKGSLGKLYPHEICIYAGEFAAISANEDAEHPVTVDSLNTSNEVTAEKTSEEAGNDMMEKMQDAADLSEDEEEKSPSSRVSAAQTAPLNVSSTQNGGKWSTNTAMDSFSVSQQPTPDKAETSTSPDGAASSCPTVTLLTLAGFEHLLDPTTVGLSLCLRVYSQLLGKPYPFESLTLLFLPLPHSFHNYGIDSSCYIASSLHSQSYEENRMGISTLCNTSELMMHIDEEMGMTYCSSYYTFGSTLVISMEHLHSTKDIGIREKCFESRITIAEAVASIWFGSIVQVFPEGAGEDQFMLLGLRKYLVDQYIEANFGTVELTIRRWERIQRYASLVELGYEKHPLRFNRNSFVTFSDLMYSEIYHLKCSLLFYSIEKFFMGQPFLPEGFYISIIRAFVNSSIKRFKKGQAFSSDSIWQKVLHECTRRYVNEWNSKPQNKLAERQIVMRGKKVTEETLSEHDQLRYLLQDWEAFWKAYVIGTGCCQMNLSFIVQLQRKGTAIDYFGFYLDQKPLQPPPSLDDSGVSAFYPAELSGMAAFNLWITKYLQMKKLETEVFDGHVKQRCWQNLIASIGGERMCENEGDSKGGDNGVWSSLHVSQGLYDPIDAFGRDGNFVLGFGYVGTQPYEICIGNGELWRNAKAVQEKSKCNLKTFSEKCVDERKFSWTHQNEQFQVSTHGGLPYWQLLLTQKQNLMKLLQSNGFNVDDILKEQPSSAGFGKFWPGVLRLQIVEDDGVRDEIKRVRDGLFPIRFQVDPRAERGRKKVASKGDRPVGMDLSADAAHEEGGYALASQGITTPKRTQFVGEVSESDKHMIEALKKIVLLSHPEYLQLDNRSLVAKVCSKTKLPILWINADPDVTWMCRFRRCQSCSMWEQQLLNDNNPACQIEAVTALSYLLPQTQRVGNELLLRGVIDTLARCIRQPRWHPFVRSRCIYALCFFHNRFAEESTYVLSIFQNYITYFHTTPDFELKHHRSAIPSELRFMRHFYRALSLLRESTGRTPSNAISLLLQPLTSCLPENEEVEYMNYCALLIDNLGNTCLPHVEQKVWRELQHPYFSFLKSYHNQRGAEMMVGRLSEGEGGSFGKKGGGRGEVSDELEMIWLNLWRFFRLDAVEKIASTNKRVTAAILRVLTRQSTFRELARQKFLNEADFSCPFDFLLFVPLRHRLHLVTEAPTAYALTASYMDFSVHYEAIRAELLLCCGGWIRIFKIRVDNSSSPPSSDGCYTLKSVFTDECERIHIGRSGVGVLAAIECCIELEMLFEEGDWRLKDLIWRAFYSVLIELKNFAAILFLPFSSTSLKEMRHILSSRNENEELYKEELPTTVDNSSDIHLLGHLPHPPHPTTSSDLQYIKFAERVSIECCKKLWKHLKKKAGRASVNGDQIFEDIKNVYSFLFGDGRPPQLYEKELPHAKLNEIFKRNEAAGAPLKKLCIFRHQYLEKHLSTDWLDVAYNAICSLSEMPEAKFFLNDPESIIENYRYIIREPMWFKKVEAKLRNRMYKMAMEFKSDVTKIFRNAKEFTQNCISDKLPFDLQAMKKDCQSMEEQFNSIWRVISKTFQEAEKKKHQQLQQQKQ